MKMPLAGIRVLDLSRLLPGPYCTMALADMGAEVLKVEDTGLGDYMRTMPGVPVVKKETSTFLMINRNKKSMTLNLKSDQGKEVFMKLAKEYDVILEQFRPGVMDALGVGYEDVKKINPGMVYCSLSGFGQYGPYKDMAGHDLNYLGVTGVLDATKVNGRPVIPGIKMGDLCGGAQWAIIGILTALMGRERNGQGQYLDVSMTDGLLALLNGYASYYFATGQMATGEKVKLQGNDVYYNIYETKDGRYVTIGCIEPKFWKGFCKLIDRPDLIPCQFEPDPKRTEMLQEVTAIIKTKTQAEWVELVGDKDICFSPVKNLEEAFADPHNQARNMLVEMDHPIEGKIKSIAYPVKFSDTPFKVVSPPPLSGEHTEEVLKEIDYSKNEIEELKKSGAI